MKENTSFTSLPTGAHLHLAGSGETKFVFNKTVEQNSQTIEIAEGSVDHMMDKLHTKTEVRKETEDVKTDVESKEKYVTAAEIIADSDRMRATVAEKSPDRTEAVFAKYREEFQKTEPDFKKLDEDLNKKLVEEYGGKKYANSSDPIAVKKWITEHVKTLPPEGQRQFRETLHQKLLATATKHENIFQKTGGWIGRVSENAWASEQSVSDRIGNSLGAGLTSAYITGLFYGAANPHMWVVGGTFAVVAGLLPGAAEGIFKVGDEILDISGQALNYVFTKITHLLTGIARGDMGMILDREGKMDELSLKDLLSLEDGPLLDGKTFVNERREEITEKFYTGETERPKLKMKDANGEEVDMIDGRMHKRFLRLPTTEEEREEEALSPDQCQRAAQFCVEMFDPEMLLLNKNLTKEQQGRIAKMTRGPHAKFDEWDAEMIEFIKRTLASREAVLAWNYFMIHSSKTERDEFAKAFARKWKEQQHRRKGQLPEEIQQELKEKMENIYPDIKNKLAQKGKEGIASFMSDGGLEDILIALCVGMFAVYGTVFASRGLQKLFRKETWEKTKSVFKKSKEKLEKNKKAARSTFLKLMNKNAEDMKPKNWKSICGALFGMGVIHASERKSLEEIVDNKKWKKIVMEMKNQVFVGKNVGNDFKSTQEIQNAFWNCVDKDDIGKRGLSIGTLDEKNEKEKTIKRKNSLEYFDHLKNMSVKYEEFKSTRPKVKALKLIKSKNIEGDMLKEFWEPHFVGSLKTEWQDIMADFVGEKKVIYEHLETLGVHENEIKIYKSLPKTNGERKDQLLTQIKSLLEVLYGSVTSETPTT
jgi:hypothetical protein